MVFLERLFKSRLYCRCMQLLVAKNHDPGAKKRTAVTVALKNTKCWSVPNILAASTLKGMRKP